MMNPMMKAGGFWSRAGEFSKFSMLLVPLVLLTAFFRQPAHFSPTDLR